ncbi:MAG: hypothetical protein WC477_02990 [Patescibacteria group bacterium]
MITFDWIQDPLSVMKYMGQIQALAAQLKNVKTCDVPRALLEFFFAAACTSGHVVLALDEDLLGVVGMATLVPIRKLTGFEGMIHDFVVTEQRVAPDKRRDIQQQLMDVLIAKAKLLEMETLYAESLIQIGETRIVRRQRERIWIDLTR